MTTATKMVSILSADWHLDSQTRNEYRHVFVEKTLPEMIKTYRYHRLVVLGDICQDKDRHNAELVNRVVEQITRLSKLCEVVILRGNHDYIDPGSPFFAFLARLHDVVWINKPTLIGNELFLPHTRDHQQEWKGALSSLKNVERIFAHQTFAGANVGPRTLDGIPLTVFPAGIDIISGDVHVPQKIGNLRYVGAPYTINFGDSYKPRVLILRNGKLTTLPVPGPQKILLEIDDIVHMPNVKINKGDMVKARIKLDKFEDFAKIKTYMTEWLANHGAVVHAIQPIVNSGKNRFPGGESKTTKSDEDHVRAYASKTGISDEVLAAGLRFID